MVQSKPLRLDWLPAVALSSALALLMLLWSPPVGDLAAQVFRTELFESAGLAIWNGSWYGGHYTLTYSLLFPPLAALLGPQVVGGLAVVSSSYLFDRLVRDRWGVEARWATLWFGAGVVTLLADGQLTFALGVAFGLAALRCLQTERAPLALAAAAACPLASPVAGAFLALAAAARTVGSGRPELGRATVLALPVAIGGATMATLFPEGGDDRFVATAFWPMLAVAVAGTALLAPGRRALRAGALLYVAVLVGAFVIPTPFGQNALRLPVLLGPALLMLAPRAAAPRFALVGVVVALVYLQWLPAVRAVAEAHGDPSTAASFYAEPRAFLSGVVRPGERVEVAFTHNHWEAAHLATAVPLARGWERQLDEKANPLFYDGRQLTASRYHRWLQEAAVRWVALPDAPLDYSAEAEARLLEQGVPYLRLAHESPGWRIWEVRDASPPASGGARVVATDPAGFEIEAGGPTVVRQRYTRWWRSDGACVSRAPGGWTRVTPVKGPIVRVHAGFPTKDGPDCPRALAGG
jgi:hypothetical protein